MPGGFYNTPYAITAGPDGALWFTENQSDGNEIVRITTAREMTQYFVPTSDGTPTGITTGPDGALWFTEYATANIGRFTTAGLFTEYTIGAVGITPIGITAGPDGALWFTAAICPGCCLPACTQSVIGRITTTGLVTKFGVPTDASSANGIAAGPDGALWFAAGNANAIGRAPACALGLSASFSGQTLTTNFDLGIDRTAIWSIFAEGAVLLQKPTPAVVPPTTFSFDWKPFPNEGEVVVASALSTAAGAILCSEWTTVKPAPN